MSSFDRITPYYDFLARIVFGKSVVEAQEFFLSEIKEGDRVLILGGGTGWILESIFKATKPGEIWYIDSSQKMIEKSKSRKIDPSKVHFIHGTEKEIPMDMMFDVVITNFFLDVFSPKELPRVIKYVAAKMKPQGVWLCTDFVDTKKWKHKLLVSSMYSFFNVVANLKNNALPDWEGNLVAEGMIQHDEKSFWKGFIKSKIFKRAF